MLSADTHALVVSDQQFQFLSIRPLIAFTARGLERIVPLVQSANLTRILGEFRLVIDATRGFARGELRSTTAMNRSYRHLWEQAATIEADHSDARGNVLHSCYRAGANALQAVIAGTRAVSSKKIGEARKYAAATRTHAIASINNTATVLKLEDGSESAIEGFEMDLRRLLRYRPVVDDAPDRAALIGPSVNIDADFGKLYPDDNAPTWHERYSSVFPAAKPDTDKATSDRKCTREFYEAVALQSLLDSYPIVGLSMLAGAFIWPSVCGVAVFGLGSALAIATTNVASASRRISQGVLES